MRSNLINKISFEKRVFLFKLIIFTISKKSLLSHSLASTGSWTKKWYFTRNGLNATLLHVILEESLQFVTLQKGNCTDVYYFANVCEKSLFNLCMSMYYKDYTSIKHVMLSSFMRCQLQYWIFALCWYIQNRQKSRKKSYRPKPEWINWFWWFKKILVFAVLVFCRICSLKVSKPDGFQQRHILSNDYFFVGANLTK